MNFRFLVFLVICAVSSTSALLLYASKKSYDEFSLSQLNLEKLSRSGQEKIVSSINHYLNPKLTTSENTNQILQSDLTRNWDLEELGLSLEEIEPLLANHQPESIVIYDIDGTRQIYPKNYAQGSAQSDKTLFITRHALIRKIAMERFLQSNENLNKNFNTDLNQDSEDFFELDKQIKNEKENEKDKNKDKENEAVPLPYNAYSIATFSAGTRHNGSVLVPVASDYRAALDGPDYSFDQFPASDSVKMKAHLSTVLPLGNNGTLVLQVNNNGVIVARGGFDFSVYQTTFRISENDFWHKFAYIGVSNAFDLADVRWFPCEPKKGILNGCVGVVPTDEGGDQFSLSTVGLREARYIWIKDIGSNFDIRSKWPTEGCALDALRIYHAYIAK